MTISAGTYTIGTGQQYSTLSTFEAAIASGALTGVLTAQMVTAENFHDRYTFAGWSTTATNYLVIEGVGSGKHSGRFGTGCVISHNSASGFGCLQFDGSTGGGMHTKVRDLSFVCEGSSSYVFRAQSGSATITDAFLEVDRCLCYDDRDSDKNGGTTSYLLAVAQWDDYATPGGVKFTNCVFRNLYCGGPGGDTDAVYADHCTAIRQPEDPNNTNASFRYVRARNCVGFYAGGSSSFWNYLNMDAGSTKNASDDSTGSEAALDNLWPPDELEEVVTGQVVVEGAYGQNMPEPSGGVAESGTFTIPANTDAIVVVAQYYNGTDTPDVTGIDLGDGTNWDAMTELQSDETTSSTDRGWTFAQLAPDVTHDRIRVSTANADAGYNDNRPITIVFLSGVQQNQSVSAVFPTANRSDLWNDQSTSTGTLTDSVTDGHAGDIFLAMTAGWPDLENDRPVMPDEGTWTEAVPSVPAGVDTAAGAGYCDIGDTVAGDNGDGGVWYMDYASGTTFGWSSAIKGYEYAALLHVRAQSKWARVERGANDVVPSRGSTLIGAGANIGVTEDILGNPRNTSAPTLGAFELTRPYSGRLNFDGTEDWEPSELAPQIINTSFRHDCHSETDATSPGFMKLRVEDNVSSGAVESWAVSRAGVIDWADGFDSLLCVEFGALPPDDLGWGIILNADLGSGAGDYYGVSFENSRTELRVNSYWANGGSFTIWDAGATASHGLTIAINTKYWVRLQYTGTVLRAKIWEDGSSEPGSWTTSWTHTMSPASGPVGLTSSFTDPHYYHYFSWATGGHDAPGPDVVDVGVLPIKAESYTGRGSGNAYFSSFIAPFSGAVKQIHFHSGDFGSGDAYKIALYEGGTADNDITGATKIYDTGELDAPPEFGTINVGTTVTLTKGTRYWYVFAADSSSPTYEIDDADKRGDMNPYVGFWSTNYSGATALPDTAPVATGGSSSDCLDVRLGVEPNRAQLVCNGVQSGFETVVEADGVSGTITITAVDDMAKSLVLWSEATASVGSRPGRQQLTLELTATNTLTWKRQDNNFSADDMLLSWQVIEFDGLGPGGVQRGRIDSRTTTDNATLGTSVDLAHAVPVLCGINGDGSDGQSLYIDVEWPKPTLTSGTNLQLDAVGTIASATNDLAWQVIEFSDDVRVLRGLLTLPDSTLTGKIVLPESVNPDTSIAQIAWVEGFALETRHDRWGADVTGAREVTIYRPSVPSGGWELTVVVDVIDFNDSGAVVQKGTVNLTNAASEPETVDVTLGSSIVEARSAFWPQSMVGLRAGIKDDNGSTPVGPDIGDLEVRESLVASGGTVTAIRNYRNGTNGSLENFFQVIEFPAPAGGPASPTITNVSPSSFKHGDTNIVVTGTNFGATQGSSTLDIDGVVQTGLTWTDTQITIPTVSIPGIPDKASYVRVDIN